MIPFIETNELNAPKEICPSPMLFTEKERLLVFFIN